jgi:succinate dehydrogenase / fumarate reductase cytochrome b subunit
VVVALTGLALIGFLLAHLSGNLLIFAGPEALAAYAQGLRRFPTLLLVARVGLGVIFVTHVTFAVRLNLANKAARPVPYAKKSFRKASFASRTMVLSGLLLLSYILFHLAHFTFRVTSPEVAALGPFQVYEMLVMSFQNPVVSLTYILSMAVMGLHLSHGATSLFQTLGVNHKKYNGVILCIGPTLGWALALGFSSIPVAVLVGFVK